MPFPIIPLIVGAAAGALVTYFLTNRSTKEAAEDKEASAGPTDTKSGVTP